jgi:hypothetical protein
MHQPQVSTTPLYSDCHQQEDLDIWKDISDFEI